jgi:hypothetical protein
MSAAQVEAAMSRRQEIIAAYRGGCVNRNLLASRFGVSKRTIERALRGICQGRKSVPVDPDAALALLAEGMPANWASETLGVSYEALRPIARTIPDHDEAVREWKRAWSAIKRNPELLDLHEQFAPPPTHAPRFAA